jgi:hypothetical protein
MVTFVLHVKDRVARFSYKKTQFEQIVEGFAKKCSYILWSFGLYILWPLVYLCCGHLVYVVVIWYILWSLGIFPPVLVCTKIKSLNPGQETFLVHLSALYTNHEP